MSTTQFEEMKAWSILSPKPTFLYKDMCFWYGLFMHKSMALAIASSLLMNIPITPSQKKALWDSTFNMVHDARRLGYEPDFKINEYTPDRLVSYLHQALYERVFHEDTLSDWVSAPWDMFDYFLTNQ